LPGSDLPLGLHESVEPAVVASWADRAAGPLPISQAYEIVDRLRRVLEEAGLSVSVEEVPDD
jgi:hypothetical protein